MISNKEKNFLSVVVYVQNNQDEIKFFLESITKICNQNFENFEIICVNDASYDLSLERIKEFSKEEGKYNISVLNMSFYQGLEVSMLAGVNFAIGDFVFEFDSCTIDYEEEKVIDSYKKSLEGYDIVSVVPSKSSNVSSKLFYYIYNKFSKTNYNLRTETFRILSRRAINRVQDVSRTIPYRKAIYSNCGLSLETIEYNPKNRIINFEDKIKTNNGFETQKRKVNKQRRELAINSLILFTDIAYKIALFMTIFMIFVTIFTALYSVIIFLTSQPIQGWTTTMLFLSVGFFGVFAIFVIVIKYLSVILDLIFRKQQYAIKSIEKLSN